MKATDLIFISAHDDAAEGAYMLKAMQDFQDRNLLFKPKPIKQNIKISNKKLKKQLGKKINIYECYLKYVLPVL